MREIGPPENMRCGMQASGLSRRAMDRANLRTASGKCPCGEVFDMHGPDAVLVHVPHIAATGTLSVNQTGERARPPGGQRGTTGAVQATGLRNGDPTN